ncbi:hypothetical protein FDECE_2912 [Fusarium decemcellulare]|nr:hypothetical protein FDECE_2912 [Fusarium decemcellulare]
MRPWRSWAHGRWSSWSPRLGTSSQVFKVSSTPGSRQIHARATEFLPNHLPEWTESQISVREAISKICSQYSDDYWLERDTEHRFPWELYQDLASNGWLGICLPEAYGGSELGISEASVMLQTISESGAGMNGASSVHMNIFGLEPVAKFGSEEQKKRWLVPLIQGKERACFGVTEPNTGLDTLRLQSFARRNGDHYILKGSKVFISTAQVAEKILVLARTTPLEEVRKPSEGLSLFYTDLDRSAVQIAEIPKMGRSAVDTNALFFEDWKVPAEDLIGKEGDGFKIIMHGMNAERILVGAEALGLGYAALRRACNYANERVVFGNSIGKYQGIQHPLAECWMHLESARLMIYLAARLYDQGYADGEYANAGKYLASEAAFKAAERAVMSHGGMGYAKEYHVERYLRESTLTRIAPDGACNIPEMYHASRQLVQQYGFCNRSKNLKAAGILTKPFGWLPQRRPYSTPAAPSGKENRGPLNGIRVLDLSRVLAAPFCTQILGDYGADVIKIEAIGKGDDTRHWKMNGETAAWKKTAGPMSNYFSAVNRNKRSVTVDIKHPKGKEILLRLAETADIIRGGYDPIAGAEAGLLHVTGQRDGPPVRPGLGIVDMATGLYLHGAILAALRAREQGAEGQRVDASLFETQISLLANVGLAWLNLGIEAQRWGCQHPSIAPYDAFKTKDAYLVCGATNDAQFASLCKLLGLEKLVDDERFSTNPKRVENRDLLGPIFNGTFGTKTTAEWMAIFGQSELPFAPINNMEQTFAHPQALARGMVAQMDVDAAESGQIKVIGPAVKFSETGTSLNTPPARLGQHTEEVLAELGIGTSEVKELRQQGAV